MANYYLRSSDGSDASDGLSWANAKATLAGVFAACSAGDTVFVSDDHAETQATAMTLTSPGTAASPVRVLCVDDTSDPEPPTALSTTATITTTTNAGLSIGGFAYFYGITFSCGTGGSSATFQIGTVGSPGMLIFDSCKLKLGTSGGTNSVINFHGNSSGSDDSIVELINTTYDGSVTQHGLRVGCKFIWRNTPNALVGSLGYTTLFNQPASFIPVAEIIGVDLSALGSGKNLVNVGSASHGRWTFIDCKLGSSVALATGSIPGQGGPDVTFINCDSADTNYRYHKQVYQGTITQETTIVRTGGASDGTTPVSRKMVSTANSKFFSPLVSDWVGVWEEEAFTPIVLVDIIHFGSAALKDDEAWLEVEVLATSGFPLGVFGSDRMASILGTPSNQDSSGSVWTGPSARANSTAYSLNDLIVVQGRICICTTAGTSAGSEPGDYDEGITADGGSVSDGTAVFRIGWRQALSVDLSTVGSGTTEASGLVRARVNLAKASTTIYFDPKIQLV